MPGRDILSLGMMGWGAGGGQNYSVVAAAVAAPDFPFLSSSSSS